MRLACWAALRRACALLLAPLLGLLLDFAPTPFSIHHLAPLHDLPDALQRHLAGMGQLRALLAGAEARFLV